MISSSNFALNTIQSIDIVSPQTVSISYKDILSSSLNYDLNSGIQLIDIDGNTVPWYFYQNFINYTLTMTSNFNVSSTLNYNYKFSVKDY